MSDSRTELTISRRRVKSRWGPAGIHLFDRLIGTNILIDEVRVPPHLWSAARDAEEAERLIRQLTEQVARESGTYDYHNSAVPDQRFSESIEQILSASRLYSLYPAELQQFELEVSVERKEKQIHIRTDEIDVFAFLKVLLDKGARVEVYSAHE